MKVCPNCKEKFETGKFCQFCGSPLQDEVQELHCTACGAKLASGAKFCSECGAKVGSASVAKAVEEPAKVIEEKAVTSQFDLSSLGYKGIKECPLCHTLFSADRRFCSKCGMQCGDTTLTNAPYEEAAKLGDTKAVAYLECVKKQQAEQQAARKKAQEEYEKKCKFDLAFDLMYSDNADEENYPEAFDSFKELADKGYVEAYFWLARCYDNGFGCNSNKSSAVYWYQKAVDFDEDPYAMADLGEAYLFGDGITKDENKAFELFKKSAAKNVAKGQFFLGWCSINGSGCEVNENRAYQNFQSAVKNDYGSFAKLWLARCYENGWGINQNPQKAYRFYHEAAEEGNEEALFNEGGCLLYGFGTSKDEKRGLELIQEAADSGVCDNAVEFLKELNNNSSTSNYNSSDDSTGFKVGGAALGAGIGTAICPGLGTVIGGGIGWLAGKIAGNS